MTKFAAAIQGQRFDHYVVLGDVVDFRAVSRFAVGKPGQMMEPLKRECDMAADIMAYHGEILKKTNPDVQLHFIQGNHGFRLDDLLIRQPALDGLIDISTLLKLTVNGYSFTPYPKRLKIGAATFMHGLYAGTTHARRHAASGENIIYGHTHSIEHNVHPGFGGAIGRAWSVGCLCRMDMDYIRGPIAWEHGYAIINASRRMVNVNQIRI